MKKYVSILLLLMLSTILSAQNYLDSLRSDTTLRDGYVEILTPYVPPDSSPNIRHQISVRVGGGLNTMKYKSFGESGKMGPGWMGEVDYTYFLSNHWGVGTGLGLSCNNSEFNVSDYSIDQALYDETNLMSYTLHTDYASVNETQRLYQLEIPIAICLRSKPVKIGYGMMSRAGVKFGIPVTCTYRSDGNSYTTTAYYPELGVTFHDLPEQGLSSYKGEDVKGDVEIRRWNVEAFADVGMTYKFNKTVDLYLGAYATIGLTDLDPSQKVGAKTSVLSKGGIDNLSMLEIGVNIGVNFNMGKFDLE